MIEKIREKMTAANERSTGAEQHRAGTKRTHPSTLPTAVWRGTQLKRVDSGGSAFRASTPTNESTALWLHYCLASATAMATAAVVVHARTHECTSTTAALGVAS